MVSTCANYNILNVELRWDNVYTLAMTLTFDQWKSLLDTPAPINPERVAGIANREEQKRADAAMWTAIEEGDLRALCRALNEGARLTNRKKGRLGLWEALHRDHWDLAHYLVQAGADLHGKTLSNYSLLGAIAHRDDPEQAQRLVTMGFDEKKSSMVDFFHGKGAPALLEWWLEHGHPEAFNAKPIRLMDWLHIGAKGSARLRAMINEAWGIDSLNPNEFAKSFDRNDPLERFWADIFQKNDVELVRRLLKSGWGFHEDKPQYNCKPSWLAASKGAWEVSDWLYTSEAFKQRMLEDAKNSPHSSWWQAATNNIAIERIAAMGVDIEAQDDWGRNLANHLLSNRFRGEFRKHTVAWLLTHYPNLFNATDKAGKTPRDSIDPENWAQVNAMLIKRATKTQKSELTPARVRRI